MNKFETIENMITNKLQSFGVMKGNFELFWQDDKGDFNVIKDNDDLSQALDELNVPLFELIACFLSKGNQGEKIIPYFIKEILNGKTFNSTVRIKKNLFLFIDQNSSRIALTENKLTSLENNEEATEDDQVEAGKQELSVQESNSASNS